MIEGPDSAEFTRLLQCAKSGDADASCMLIQNHLPVLRKIAQRRIDRYRLNARFDGSDIVYKTFDSAFRAFHNFGGTTDTDLRRWLLRILRHNTANAIRQHRTQKRDNRREAGEGHAVIDRVPGNHRKPESVAIVNEQVERLTAAIKTLPPRQRDAVQLWLMERKPFSNVTQRLDRPADDTGTDLWNGIRSLRKLLGQTS